MNSSRRCIEQSNRFIHKCFAADHPIKCVLHHAGDAVCVFWTSNNQRIGSDDLSAKIRDGGRIGCLDVRIEQGNFTETFIKHYRDAAWCKASNSTQQSCIY